MEVRASDFAGLETPLTLDRNLTVTGLGEGQDAWPSLGLNASDKMTLGPRARVYFTQVVLVISLTDMATSSLSMFTASAEGAAAQVVVANGGTVLVASGGNAWASASAWWLKANTRAAGYPGWQIASFLAPQPANCNSNTSTPPLQRCWAVRATVLDGVLDAVQSSPGQASVSPAPGTSTAAASSASASASSRKFYTIHLLNLTLVFGDESAARGITTLQPGERVVSVAVTNGPEMVAALANGTVTEVVVTSQFLNITDDDFEAAATNVALPLVLGRNVTVRGAPGLWPLLTLSAVNKISLGPRAMLSFTALYVDPEVSLYLFRATSLVNTVGRSVTDDPGSRVVIHDAAVILDLGLDGFKAYGWVVSLPRSESLPGMQVMDTWRENVTDCSTDASAPPAQRCWALIAKFVDVATPAVDMDRRTGVTAALDYDVVLLNTTVHIKKAIPKQCLDEVDPVACYFRTRVINSTTTTNLTAIAGGLQQQELPQTQGQPQQAAPSAAPTPTAAAAGGGQAPAAAAGAAGTDSSSGGGASDSTLAIVLGCVLGGLGLIGAAVAAVFVVARGRRRRRAEQQASGAAAGSKGSGNHQQGQHNKASPLCSVVVENGDRSFAPRSSEFCSTGASSSRGAATVTVTTAGQSSADGKPGSNTSRDGSSGTASNSKGTSNSGTVLGSPDGDASVDCTHGSAAVSGSAASAAASGGQQSAGSGSAAPVASAASSASEQQYPQPALQQHTGLASSPASGPASSAPSAPGAGPSPAALATAAAAAIVPTTPFRCSLDIRVRVRDAAAKPASAAAGAGRGSGGGAGAGAGAFEAAADGCDSMAARAVPAAAAVATGAVGHGPHQEPAAEAAAGGAAASDGSPLAPDTAAAAAPAQPRLHPAHGPDAAVASTAELSSLGLTELLRTRGPADSSACAGGADAGRAQQPLDDASRAEPAQWPAYASEILAAFDTHDSVAAAAAAAGSAAAAAALMQAGASTSSGGGGGRPSHCAAHVVELTPRVLGKGAYGRVVEGRYHGRPVAVKLLLSAADCSPGGHNGGGAGAAGPTGAGTSLEQEHISAFVQEIEILGRVDHPCVVRLLAACVVPPRLALVMEMMETSLEALVLGRPPGTEMLPLPTVLHIAVQVAQGLEYLHPTILHRDLKPANVLISGAHTDRPVAKLSDFGLSRIRLQTLPTRHPEAGTPAYMAPELFDITNNTVSHRADVYSLAVLMWVMLTGEQPWKGYSVAAMAFSVSQGRRLPLLGLAPQRCPHKLVRLLDACWDTDPLRRPAAAEVAKELMLIQELVSGRACGMATTHA
ncbi:hypothetical protein HXX76_002045 [Chlamydomonas incerta]|uniref:Protein kinase domain-containing protein n=1 Tax=Chlamydomonas incerta TaxID=51695 RepID=A0A835WAB6_CHLIN|nr:hypothetical protein HXX76_002045 [Chlamydomonas incerta]|eukprot:KAG2443697.1 hypothetical protein HXX76_002045 [Chlamydomonas incerta]